MSISIFLFEVFPRYYRAIRNLQREVSVAIHKSRIAASPVTRSTAYSTAYRCPCEVQNSFQVQSYLSPDSEVISLFQGIEQDPTGVPGGWPGTCE